MKNNTSVLLLVALLFFCCGAAGVLLAATENRDDEREKAEDEAGPRYLQRLENARTHKERITAKEEISKELSVEFEQMLAWLKTKQGVTEGPFEKESREVLLIELLSDVRWFGAIDFFIDNITWHTRISLRSDELIPKWTYFPCAMALLKYKGCELKIAKAALIAKRDIEMQLLCIVLTRMTEDVKLVEELLVLCAGNKEELKAPLKEAQAFLKTYDVRWNPYDCKDFDVGEPGE